MFLQAEEITLTIGQAFELAYKKFLESKGKDLEKEKQSMVMHKRIELLENENKELKKRLTDIANIKGDNDVKQYMRENNVSAFTVKITQECELKIATVNTPSFELFIYHAHTCQKIISSKFKRRVLLTLPILLRLKSFIS